MDPVSFVKTSEPLSFDKKLGLCFGWFCFSKQAGVEYDDEHGDHFPDDELVIAVDALMAKSASEREINIEHTGAGRGSIATAVAMTEDVAKAYGIDTGGTYGVLGSFRPDADLLKSIEAGERYRLSIEGRAHNVETVAKSAECAPAAGKRKRVMRGVELTKLAVVKAGAHRGAAVALIKTAPTGAQTDTETTMTTTADIEKAQAETATARADLAKSQARAITLGSMVLVAATLPPEQSAYAKTLPVDALETFLALDATARAAKATPAYVSKSTGVAYYDHGMAELAKSLDAAHADVAKAREANEALAFEKRAAETIPGLKGTPTQLGVILKAIEGIADEATRTVALECLKSASGVLEGFTKRVGHNGGALPLAGAGPEAELEALAKTVHKDNPSWTFAKAYDAALDTPKGQALYAQIQTPEWRVPRSPTDLDGDTPWPLSSSPPTTPFPCPPARTSPPRSGSSSSSTRPGRSSSAARAASRASASCATSPTPPARRPRCRSAAWPRCCSVTPSPPATR